MPKPSTPRVTPKNKKGKSRSRTSKVPQTPTVPATPEPLTLEEAQKMVQFCLSAAGARLDINDALAVGDKDNAAEDSGIEIKEEKEAIVPLPEASYREMSDHQIIDAPARPNAYIRFIEKSVEELDGEVEYDVDEEDTAWLSLVNKKRELAGLSLVPVDTLELLMDRLEKESYFQASANGQTGAVVDDDAVCCICMDGECQNTNVILFCDMCNLAVHQDCYGVPYIPEGQWLCRRCLQSPSRAVDCVLCPNQGGAFKQTDKGLWAHVVCALWIPEVRFANTVFLEPIDSIEMIPPARWRLVCYICKQKNLGACIQCHKNNCYSAFHVTCAQSAGLYMKMDTVKDSGGDSQPVLVQKIAYCDAHVPPDFNEEHREDMKLKMKQARKLLAKKRGSVPVILIPTIPPDKIQEISTLVHVQKKSQFIQRLIAYWTLKRQFRNGVPLLRRLQSAQGGSRESNASLSVVDTIELCRQLKYWQCLRQDLERARLLCELVRKREKLKVELTRSAERCWNLQLKPLEASMSKLLALIAAKDTNEIFTEPVDLDEVPDYTTVVTHPMDLGTMRTKLERGEYAGLEDMERDFYLMISNCFEYNDKDTVFYRAATKMRDQGAALFKAARKECESHGLVEVKVEPSECASPLTPSAVNVRLEFEQLKGQNGPDALARLKELLGKCSNIKQHLQRAKRMKQIRTEIQRVQRLMANADDSKEVVVEEPPQEDDTETTKLQQPSSAGTSPSGVNRRTAVLLTRKAQAAFKKPPDGTSDPGGEKEPIRETVVKGKKAKANKEDETDIPESFRVYRSSRHSSCEEDSDSGTSLSTCYSHELCEIATEDEDDDDDEEDEDAITSCLSEEEMDVDVDVDIEVDADKNIATPDSKQSKNVKNASIKSNAKAAQPPVKSPMKSPMQTTAQEELVLRPLTLVWAKCRGYPWYPALIMDPKIPKGFVHRGVPLPSPPAEVIALRDQHANDALLYLVLFFDAKRTWQWLPAEKLEALGADADKDEAKANEPRKPTDRKAVRKAYQDAQQYITQTTREHSDTDGT